MYNIQIYTNDQMGDPHLKPKLYEHKMLHFSMRYCSFCGDTCTVFCMQPQAKTRSEFYAEIGTKNCSIISSTLLLGLNRKSITHIGFRKRLWQLTKRGPGMSRLHTWSRGAPNLTLQERYRRRLGLSSSWYRQQSIIILTTILRLRTQLHIAFSGCGRGRS